MLQSKTMILNFTTPVALKISDHFNKWLKKLKNKRVQGKIILLMRQVEEGDLGEVKALGKGLYEKKINLGPGYRLYLAQLGEV
jgi:putative addiction module killer protein